MDGIQSLFWPVLAIVTVLSLIAAVWALARSGKQWDDYGRQHLLMERDPEHGEMAWSQTAARERDEEIRELLTARNERRRRRGEAAIDVDAEFARLTADPGGTGGPAGAADPSGAGATPHIDAALRAEIRDLVIARNHRRARSGKPPLDVEAEVAREIEGLSERH